MRRQPATLTIAVVRSSRFCPSQLVSFQTDRLRTVEWVNSWADPSEMNSSGRKGLKHNWALFFPQPRSHLCRGKSADNISGEIILLALKTPCNLFTNRLVTFFQSQLRERERERDRDGDRNRQTDTEADRQTERHRPRERLCRPVCQYSRH